MQNKVIWINIKVSRLGRLVFLLGYALLLLSVTWHSNPATAWLLPLILVQGGWSWRQAFGAAAPVAFIIQNNQLRIQLASGQLRSLQPPLARRSRYFITFKRKARLAWLAWPWLLWPDAISASEHHQLRYFLRSWR